jgi:hypothetical protein
MRPVEVAEALKRLAGTPRALIYDVSEAGAPTRDKPQTPFVHGSQAWWSYVDRRRELDDGEDLTVLISMRGLSFDERMLVVSWGTAYANSFLVIEPADPWLDLTTQDGVDAFTKASNLDDADALVRRAYAEWIYWTRDDSGELESRRATLSLDGDETLFDELWRRLPQTFPAEAFLSSLTLLQLREAELFVGGREVARAIVPFLTRLGMPIVWNPRHIIQGVRQLVDAGLAWVHDPQDGWRVYSGPLDPLPPEITDEQLALMVR